MSWEAGDPLWQQFYKLCFVEIIENKKVGNYSVSGLIEIVAASLHSALLVDHGSNLNIFLKLLYGT